MTPSDATGGPFRILLCDDEPVIRELVRTMLTSPGVSVEVAPNGVDCLRAAKTSTFHLILLDIVMPEMDGITICRLLKSDPHTASVPVYMLTAKAKAADVETARKAGADGYINKPFRGAELMDLVDALQKKRG